MATRNGGWPRFPVPEAGAGPEEATFLFPLQITGLTNHPKGKFWAQSNTESSGNQEELLGSCHGISGGV